jgi:T5SS/PEP-CTERM-associated repeat protein
LTQRSIAFVLLTLALALPASVVSAQTLSWANVAGGSAATPGNWSPAQVPVAANPLVWNLASTYSVTFNATVPASLGHTFRRGTVSLTVSSPHTVGTGGVVVGDLNGDNATTTLTTGAWNSGGPVLIGDASGSTGRLTVTSAASDLTMTGASRLTVGNDGNGTLTISNIGLVSVADRLFVADGASSVGTVSVTGAQNSPPFLHSTLAVAGAAESRIGSAGDATMSVTSGGSASFAGDLTVAALSGSVSTLTVDGASFPISSVSVGGNLNLGRNSTRQTTAGNGTVRINGGGRIDVAGTINVGNDPDGGVGQFVLDGAGALVTCAGVSAVGSNALQLLDGEWRVVGGLVNVVGQSLNIGRGSVGDEAILTLRSGATITDGPVTVGVLSDGVLRVESGSAVVFEGADVSAGVNGGVGGDVVVTGAGSVVEVRALNIGTLGAGSLSVEAGGRVRSQLDIETGLRSGGHGTISVQDGLLEGEADLSIGGRTENDVLFPGGSAELVVGPLGVVTLVGNLYRFPNSTIDLEGGVINAAEFHTSVVNFASAVRAWGTINAKIRGFAPIAATGALTIGDGTQDAINDLRVEVGPHRVTCLGSGVPTDLVSVTMGGGTLVDVNGLLLETGGTVTGHGRIEGPMTSFGTITSSGGTLVFAETLNSEIGTMTGERFEFLPGANFSGKAGGTRWRAHPGTQMVFRDPGGGSISMGGNVTDAFVCEGEWTIGSDTSIGDLDGIETGPRCTIIRSALVCGTSTPGILSPVRVSSRNGVRDLLCGDAVIIAQSVRSKGIISPGQNGGEDIGIVIVEGPYEQSLDGEAGVLVIDIVGEAFEQRDRMVVNDVMTIDGTVTIRIPPSFRPVNGFSASFVAADAIVGGIDRVEIPPGWSLFRTVQNLGVTFCAPDFNSDGFVDFFDYDGFVACFEGVFCAPDATADFNGDGFVDFFDYDDFVRTFEQGC